MPSVLSHVAVAVLCGCLVAQEEPRATPEQLRAHVERAEAAWQETEIVAAQNAARAAWRVAEALDDHRDEAVQDLLVRLGTVALHAEELRVAHDAWEVVHDHRSEVLEPGDRDLLLARVNYAIAVKELGDLRGALALQQECFRVAREWLPEDHADLLKVMNGLAVTLRDLGQWQEALELQRKVLAGRERTLPAEDRLLQGARINLAVTMARLGDLRGALELEERVHTVFSRTLHDDHPDLQRIRNNLAVTKHKLGDLAGALRLNEKVLEVRSRTLPPDHPALQGARVNLASSKKKLGDFEGALALEERAVEVLTRSLPDDHPDLQAARTNLALTRRQLGDVASALVLQIKVLEVYRDSLAEDHPKVLSALSNVATTRMMLGDFEKAGEVLEQVLEVSASRLSSDHPDLRVARSNLALLRRLQGGGAESLSLQEAALETAEDSLPEGHPELQNDRWILAWNYLGFGRGEDAAAIARDADAAVRHNLADWAVAPRVTGAMARQSESILDLELALARGFGDVEAMPEMAESLFVTSQLMRDVEARAATRLRRAREADPERAARLSSELREVAGQVSRAAAGPGASGVGAWFRGRFLARAVRQKEKLQEQLVALAAEAGHVERTSMTAAELAALLPGDSAAVAIFSGNLHTPETHPLDSAQGDARMVALCLDSAGEVQVCVLGTVSECEELVALVRREAVAGAPDSGARQRLFELFVAPVLEALPGAGQLFLSLDETLQLIPLDALPNGAAPVGDQVAIRTIGSVFDFAQRVEPSSRTHGLLIFGGIDYDATPERVAPPIPGAVAPVADMPRSGEGRQFESLRHSASEIDTLQELFAQQFPTAEVVARRGNQGGKADLFELAPQARYMHLATHGYFAPEWASSIDRRPQRLLPLLNPLREHRGVTGLSPFVLCGLALAGANLPADDLGRRQGIVTAEELLAVDLSGCELVVLSACDTSLGVRRAGQGFASLRSALRGAGARFVLTSLWKVGDRQTRDLMVGLLPPAVDRWRGSSHRPVGCEDGSQEAWRAVSRLGRLGDDRSLTGPLALGLDRLHRTGDAAELAADIGLRSGPVGSTASSGSFAGCPRRSCCR